MVTENQLKEIKELQDICEAEDCIQLKLNWDMLITRNNQEKDDYFHYENGKLVGFLGLYGFGNSVEVCGMVAPAYRRKGIFTKLFNEAHNAMKERGFTDILLNAPAKSPSAKGFLQNISGKYEFTEYQMKWQQMELQQSSFVQLRPATESDLELEIRIDVESFKMDPDEAKGYNLRVKQEEFQEFLMIEVGGQVVGKIRVYYNEGETWLYGFAVLPEYQGKGIGKSALSLVVMKENCKGYPIFLEVEAKNANALKLYEACGFEAYQSQDYYRLVQ